MFNKLKNLLGQTEEPDSADALQQQLQEAQDMGPNSTIEAPANDTLEAAAEPGNPSSLEELSPELKEKILELIQAQAKLPQ